MQGRETARFTSLDDVSQLVFFLLQMLSNDAVPHLIKRLVRLFGIVRACVLTQRQEGHLHAQMLQLLVLGILPAGAQSVTHPVGL